MNPMYTQSFISVSCPAFVVRELQLNNNSKFKQFLKMIFLLILNKFKGTKTPFPYKPYIEAPPRPPPSSPYPVSFPGKWVSGLQKTYIATAQLAYS